MRAIFLDRDGVINQERVNYVRAWAEFDFLPGALSAIRQLSHARPWPIVVVTNQSVIGRGLASEEAVQQVHQRMVRAIRQAGGRVDALFFCPHAPAAGCACRKPQPGLLLAAARALPIQLAASVMVGDSWTDLLAARAAGCQPLLVQSGRQGASLPARLAEVAPPPPLLPDLAAAVTWLLQATPVAPAGSVAVAHEGTSSWN